MTPEFIAGLAVGEGCFYITVRKQKTRKGERCLSLKPGFFLGMYDPETIDLVSETLKTYDMPHVVWAGERGYKRISVEGLKRTNKFLPWIVPHLTGAKKLAAEHLATYVEYRLSLPHKSPVTLRDLDFLREARRLNGNPGRTRHLDVELLARILRDSTPDVVTTKIESELT